MIQKPRKSEFRSRTTGPKTPFYSSHTSHASHKSHSSHPRFLENQEESVKFDDCNGRYEEARDFVSSCLTEREFRERLPMPLHRMICLSGLLLFSTIGCCHTQCVSNDACNPCGVGGGCCLTNWFRDKLANCSLRCRNYSWGNDCCSACGGDSCGAPVGGYDGGMTYGGGGAAPGCACGQSHSHSQGYAPASSAPPGAPIDQPPVPIPSSGSGPTRSGEPIPAPGATDSTTFQSPHRGQVQHVSMEEFHRLPGVVVSGPGQSSVPTMAAPTLLAPPALSNVSVPPAPANSISQAQWVPAK